MRQRVVFHHGGLPAHKQRGRAWPRALVWLGVAAAVGLLGSWWVWRWVHAPLSLAQAPVRIVIAAGDSPRDIAQHWVDAGVQTQVEWLYEWFRWSGQSTRIKAGNYVLTRPASPKQILAIMVRGDQAMARVTLIEGWTFARWRQALRQAPELKPVTAGWSNARIMAALGASDQHPEGWFYPDTYVYAKGSDDLAVMRRAHEAMREQLDKAWQAYQLREGAARECPLASATKMLILASIVEKETGHPDDRGLVAGVFCNRLRIGMPLQTDPTVIYGLGAAFDGNLTRAHLRTDTPYNTYTRGGLPPTPIAMPGAAALAAVVKPADTKALYFVARGDGTSVFSENLGDHNRAVNRYQRQNAN